MVLEFLAYADESGGIDQPCCTYAGFVASPAQWKKFRAGWRAVLDRWDVPTFHASEFWSRGGWQEDRSSPYYRWSGKKALKFQLELTGVFIRQHHKIHRANGSVDVSDYKLLSHDWKRIFTVPW